MQTTVPRVRCQRLHQRLASETVEHRLAHLRRRLVAPFFLLCLERRGVPPIGEFEDFHHCRVQLARNVTERGVR